MSFQAVWRPSNQRFSFRKFPLQGFFSLSQIFVSRCVSPSQTQSSRCVALSQIQVSELRLFFSFTSPSSSKSVQTGENKVQFKPAANTCIYRDVSTLLCSASRAWPRNTNSLTVTWHRNHHKPRRLMLSGGCYDMAKPPYHAMWEILKPAVFRHVLNNSNSTCPMDLRIILVYSRYDTMSAIRESSPAMWNKALRLCEYALLCEKKPLNNPEGMSAYPWPRCRKPRCRKVLIKQNCLLSLVEMCVFYEELAS